MSERQSDGHEQGQSEGHGYDHDLAVIGGGFWGVAIARAATERGLDVVTLDDRNPIGASRNASGIIQKRWYESNTSTRMYPDWFDPDDIDWAIDWLDERTQLDDTGERFTSYQGSDGRYRDDCWVVRDCLDFLDMTEVTPARVERIDRLAADASAASDEAADAAGADVASGSETVENTADAPVSSANEGSAGWRVTYRPGPSEDAGEGVGTPELADAERSDEPVSLTADVAVVAAGAFTDELLESSGLPPAGIDSVAGRAALVDTYDHDADITHTIMPRPYKFYMLRPYRGQHRIGDTVEPELDDDKFNKLLLNCGKLAGDFEVSDVFYGLRPTADEFVVEQHAGHDDLIVAAGGHRIGMVIAPIAAKHTLTLLNQWSDSSASVANPQPAKAQSSDTS